MGRSANKKWKKRSMQVLMGRPPFQVKHPNKLVQATHRVLEQIGARQTAK